MAPSTSSAVSSPTTTVAAVTSTVEPAPAVSAVIVVAAVAVVAARGFVFPTATTRTKGDAYDHNYNHHDRNYKKRSHCDSPLLGFPESMPDSTLVRCVFTTCGTIWAGLQTRPYAIVGV